MRQDQVFLAAFVAGMTAPASLLARTNPYIAYVPRTPLEQQFAAVGLNIARATTENGRERSDAERPDRATGT
jgi:hypothetical protein